MPGHSMAYALIRELKKDAMPACIRVFLQKPFAAGAVKEAKGWIISPGGILYAILPSLFPECFFCFPKDSYHPG